MILEELETLIGTSYEEWLLCVSSEQSYECGDLENTYYNCHVNGICDGITSSDLPYTALALTAKIEEVDMTSGLYDTIKTYAFALAICLLVIILRSMKKKQNKIADNKDDWYRLH